MMNPIYLRIFCCCLLTAFSPALLAQRFLIGFHGGVNYTDLQPTASHSVVEYLIPPDQLPQNSYAELWDNGPGTQWGLSFDFEFGNWVGVEFNPSYSFQKFSYQVGYQWSSTELVEQNYQVGYTYEQRLSYIQLPLHLKLMVPLGKIVPYLKVGGFYNILDNANQTIQTSQLDPASGGTVSQPTGEVSFNVEHLLEKHQYGATGGVGVAFNLNYLRVGLEGTYLYGIQPVTNEYARFTDRATHSPAVNVLDDWQWRNVQFAMTFHFPVNFSMAAPGSKGVRYVLPYDMRKGR